MFPMLLWLAMFPRELLNVLYGARWLEAASILQVLALFAFLMPMIDNIKVLLTGIGKLREAVWIRAWQTGVTLMLLPIGIPRWGAAGVAGAATLANVAALVAGYKYLGTSVRDIALGSYIRPAIAAAIAALGVKAAHHVHLFAGTGRLVQVAYIGTVAVMYFVVLVVIDGSELQRNLTILIRGLRREEAAG